MDHPRGGKLTGAALAHFALTALAITAAWWWLGAPIRLPPSPLANGGKLYCVSYGPFRDGQDPLGENVHVDAKQIDEDLTLLSRYTDCVRTYSVEYGQDQIAGIAQRHGMKVLQGIWLSNHAAKNQQQIATVIALAKKYPDVIRAIIVGNEVLLRGDLSVTDLETAIREVKAQVSQPVTYADVWEFWLRYSDLQNFVDFVTIHILPYWEDFPLPASLAAAHVDDIRKKVAAAIPNKEIMIGEVGWPSEGRMREGALPSPANQARVIEETVALAQRENFRVNVIEAFDQSWKRQLEGATGGYWGIFDRTTQEPKFSFDDGVSDHPHWLMQALAGIVLAAFSFAGAAVATRGKTAPAWLWPRIAAMTFVPAVLFGWSLERILIDSYTAGGWLRALAFAATAAAAPIACAAACAAGRRAPAFATLLSRSSGARDGLSLAVGITLIALTLLSLQSALGLVFDPRYRDIPFAPQSGAALPFLLLMLSTPRPVGPRAMAETVAAGVLALSAGYIAFNETIANWQAIWLCAGFLGLAVILLRARDGPG
ncbi:MAG: beta-(1-6) glucans synthase [Xanthobacteraceae bacterium]